MKKIEQTFAVLAAAGKTASAAFPSEMRRQLWPLCCGATLLSGFKNTHTQTIAEIVAEIKENLAAVPDFQVFAGEQMNPQLCFTVLNASQTASPKIVQALEDAGFIKFGSASLWSGTGSFWVHAPSDFKIEDGFTSYASAKAAKVKLVGAKSKAQLQNAGDAEAAA